VRKQWTADEEATSPPIDSEADESCEPPTAEDWLAAGAHLREETTTKAERVAGEVRDQGKQGYPG
jgi:hypothetical protein